MSKEIFLSSTYRNAKYIGKIAIIDDEDYDYISQYKWTFNPAEHLGSGGGYAVTRVKSNGTVKRISMQNLIMSPPDGLIVDHINGDALNNCRSNLRLATTAQNLANRRMRRNNKSGFKGVTINKKSGKYTASIVIKTFDTAEEAAKMYDRLAKVAFGEFARLNFPD